jgi:Tol biopolymer transport system component
MFPRIAVSVSGAGFVLSILLAAQPPATNRPKQPRQSKLCIYNLATKKVRTVYTTAGIFEAPNWSPDGKKILINRNGVLLQIPSVGGTPEPIDLQGLTKCNNDKGYSPDGKLIAFSSSGNANGSQVYTVSASGGKPALLVPETPSYFHAFSPDGKYLAFVARRGGNFDLFRMPVQGGDQERLTTSPGYDDGPDYSPDGKWIYFNSNRSGKWAVWRMPAEGAGPNDSDAEQVTFDDVEDWFPHCSPDGKWLVFVAFPKGTATHDGRMRGVELRIIPLPGAQINPVKSRRLLTFYGGQGTINVNSWAPDSQEFAFVEFDD